MILPWGRTGHFCQKRMEDAGESQPRPIAFLRLFSLLPHMQRNFKKAISSLSEIFAFIDDQVDGKGIPPAGLYALRFVIEELFTNMVKYATASREDVTIGLELEGKKATIRLTDHDVDPFDPATAPRVDPQTPLQDRRVGGLGIQLVKNMVDDLHYAYADRCSTITIIKNLES